MALFDAAQYFESGDDKAATALVSQWHDAKAISAESIGRCPTDGRKQLYRLQEILADIARVNGLDFKEERQVAAASYRETPGTARLADCGKSYRKLPEQPQLSGYNGSRSIQSSTEADRCKVSYSNCSFPPAGDGRGKSTGDFRDAEHAAQACDGRHCPRYSGASFARRGVGVDGRARLRGRWGGAIVSDSPATLPLPAATMPAHDAPALTLSAADLAKELRVSVKTITRLDQNGKLPDAVHIGHAKRWMRSTIVVWLANGCPSRREWEVVSSPLESARHDFGDGPSATESRRKNVSPKATPVIQPVGPTPLLDFPRVWEIYRFILSKQTCERIFDAEHDDLMAAYLRAAPAV